MKILRAVLGHGVAHATTHEALPGALPLTVDLVGGGRIFMLYILVDGRPVAFWLDRKVGRLAWVDLHEIEPGRDLPEAVP